MSRLGPAFDAAQQRWDAMSEEAFYDHDRPDDADEDHQDPEPDFEADRYERR